MDLRPLSPSGSAGMRCATPQTGCTTFVVMDVTLPGTDGLSAARELLRRVLGGVGMAG